VMRSLAPILHDLDLQLAFETHAEATSQELLQMIDAVGSDVVGICLDTGNFPMTLEDPLAAVRRVARYAIATHLKDGVVMFADDGLVYQARPCGQGAIPMSAILDELVRSNPELRTLSVEDHDALFPVRIFHDDFVSTFDDQPIAEFAHVIRLARECERLVASGSVPSPDALEAIPWAEQALPRLEQSAHYVREQVQRCRGRMPCPA
jgi:sugar phosphate isomerase/epimerase